MADYYSPTVVQPDIPLADMTATEFLMLSAIFNHEVTHRGIYFFSELGPNLFPELGVEEACAALQADAHVDCRAIEWLKARVAKLDGDEDSFDIDLSVTSFEDLFQDIIRRSSGLTYISVVSSWTCSKMRSDGFGGMAVLITADRIRAKSTHELIHEFLDDADPTGAWREGQL